MDTDNFIFYFDISVITFTLYGNVQSECNSLSEVAQCMTHIQEVPVARQAGLTLWTDFLWFSSFSAGKR
jgi:hypothetical protein